MVTFYNFREILLEKTSVLLQLYIQPSLQGYPPFNDFPSLYNASAKLSVLAAQDIKPLFEGNIDQMVMNVIMNVPQYLELLSSMITQFGNVQRTGDRTINEIISITGAFLCSLLSCAM